MRQIDNPELFTKREMRDNDIDAYGCDISNAFNTDNTAAANAAAAFDCDDVDCWIEIFFRVSGEDKQLYINEVERLR